MYYAVDRFEGETAVLEDDNEALFTVARSLLPAGTQAGDVLSRMNGVYTAEPEETQRRREYARRLEQMLRGG